MSHKIYSCFESPLADRALARYAIARSAAHVSTTNWYLLTPKLWLVVISGTAASLQIIQNCELPTGDATLTFDARPFVDYENKKHQTLFKSRRINWDYWKAKINNIQFP